MLETPAPAAFTVRQLTGEDAAVYHALRLRSLAEEPCAFGITVAQELPLPEMAARLQDPRHYFSGAFLREKLVGFVRLSYYFSPNKSHLAYLGGLYVTPDHRGLGIGKSLSLHAIKQASSRPGLRKVNLSVVTHCKPAIQLYETLGFVTFGTDRETFSHEGLYYDEHMMTLIL